jgi:DDE_Tnp_1-associated/Transposase DDE domain
LTQNRTTSYEDAIMLPSLQTHFADLPDPRLTNRCDHKLIDLVVIAVCATLAGADSWQSIATFAHSKADWLHEWLELPHGIPSHDTFERVFRKLQAGAFEARFMAWTQAVFEQTEGQVIAIDGKTLRGMADKIHLVSAWASANGTTLGQCKVASKSNEITAIPDLLNLLTLKGCIVTIDALGCQKAIAQQLVEGKADYVLAVKGNQGQLEQMIAARFALTDDDRFAHHPQPFYTS